MIAVFLCLFSVWPQISLAQVSPSFTSEDFGGNINGAVLAIFANLFLAVINMLGALLLSLMNLMAELFSYNHFLDSYAVDVGWPLVRDVCNMFFVVILLLIAFSTILRYKAYEYKSALPRLLLMAIVINFSKTIMGLLIDFGQVLMLTFVNAFEGSVANSLVNSFGLTDMLKIKIDGAVTEKINPWEIFGGLLLAIVLLVVAIGVMLAYAAVLIYRIIVLWVLVILSPLAFFLSAFEAGKKYAQEFWTKFWSQLTTGIVMAFFMWLALSILSSDDKMSKELDISSDVSATSGQVNSFGLSNNGGMLVSEWDRLYTFVVAIALLLMALEFAQKAGGFAGKFAGGISGTLGKMGKGAVRKFTGYGWAADRFKAYRDVRKQEKAQKAQLFGAFLANIHGRAEQKVGGVVGKPFAAVRKIIADKTGFTAYKASLEKAEQQGQAFKNVKNLRESAEKNEKEANDNTTLTKDQRENMRNIAKNNRAEADRIEFENGLVRFKDPNQAKKLEEQYKALKNAKEEDKAGKQQEIDKTWGDIRKNESIAKNESTNKRTEAKTARKAAEARRKIAEAAKHSGDTARAEKFYNAASTFDEQAKDYDEQAEQAKNSVLTRTSEEDINKEIKTKTKDFLEHSSWLNLAPSIGTAKSEAAMKASGIARTEGNDVEADDYARESKRYARQASFGQYATTGLALGAALIPGVGVAAAAILLPKFINWQADRAVARGQRQENLSNGILSGQVSKEKKEMDNMHINDIIRVSDNESAPAMFRLAAIIKRLEEGFYGAKDVEMVRNLVKTLGADKNTKSYVENLIGKKFPIFGQRVNGMTIGQEIEAGILNPKDFDSSALTARHGELAYAMALNMTFQGFISALEKSKDFKDKAIEGLTEQLKVREIAGDFKDASKFGDLEKILARYTAGGKKDNKVHERGGVLLDENGQMKNTAFWGRAKNSKDIQSVLAQLRWDKILEEFGSEALESVWAHLDLTGKLDHTMPSYIEAASSDSPVQYAATVRLGIVETLYKKIVNISGADEREKEIKDQMEEMIKKTFPELQEGTNAFTDEVKKAVKNLKGQFRLCENAYKNTSSRIHGVLNFNNFDGGRFSN